MNWKYYKPKFEYEEKFQDIGWPWAGHKNFAYDLIRNLKPKIIVELGTHKGTSLWSFCQAVKDGSLDNQVWAVDTWKGDEHAGFYGEEVFREVEEIRDKYYGSVSLKLLRKTFDEAISDFKEESIDLLHIDGLHTYEAVKHDFENWITKMKRDGIIMFHDTFVDEDDFGVYKFWEELKRKYKSIEFFHSFGLGIIFLDKGKYNDTLVLEKEFQRKYSYLSENLKNSNLRKNVEIINEKDNLISAIRQIIQQKDAELQQKDAELQQKDAELQQKDAELQQKDVEIAL